MFIWQGVGLCLLSATAVKCQRLTFLPAFLSSPIGFLDPDAGKDWGQGAGREGGDRGWDG